MILELDAGSVWARLRGRCNVETAALLDRALSYVEPGSYRTWLYKSGRWDGRTHLFNPETLTFGAGLAPRVLALLIERGIPVEVQDARPSPPWPSTDVPGVNGVTLAPDQVEAARAALQEPRGCLALATGFGKTEVAAVILKAARPARGLFLVNTRTLLAQAADRFELRLGERVGRLGSGWSDTRRRVTVATVQTLSLGLARFRPLLADQRVVLYDEAHTVSPPTAFPILQSTPAPARFGLSATIREAPRRLAVEAFLGPIIIERGEQALIQAGRATQPTVYMVNAGGGAPETNDFAVVEEAGIVNNRPRNDLVIAAARQFREAGLRTFILVVKLAHGRALARELECPFLSGQSDMHAIAGAKRDFEAGRLPVMIMSTIGDFGVDLPTMEALILAGGGISALRTIQRVGRALRVAPGKRTAFIIDFYDLACALLRKHSEARLKTFRRKGFSVHRVANIEGIAL